MLANPPPEMLIGEDLLRLIEGTFRTLIPVLSRNSHTEQLA
jgi:hypothetical protein